MMRAKRLLLPWRHTPKPLLALARFIHHGSASGRPSLPPPLVELGANWLLLPQAIAALGTVPDGPASVELLRQAMSSANGYLREAAVYRSLASANPALLPDLARRINDWVPEVSLAAGSAMLALLERLPPSYFIAILPAVESLGASTRHDHAAWMARFYTRYTELVSPSALRRAAAGLDHRLARAAWRLLKNQGLLDPAALVEASLAARDIVVAMDGARCAEKLGGSAGVSCLHRMLASAFAPVRVIAAQSLLARAEPQLALATAWACLEDGDAHVRDLAIAFLRLQGIDVRQHLRQLLAEPESSAMQLRTALLSLAALRDRRDLPVIRHFCSSRCALLRHEAYKGWMRIASEDKDVIAELALHDSARRVRKLALRLVHRHGAYVPAEALAHCMVREQEQNQALPCRPLPGCVPTNPARQSMQ
ncbi:MAG: hypothetical protein ACRYGK_13830 [Janthinobacterium lividum]